MSTTKYFSIFQRLLTLYQQTNKLSFNSSTSSLIKLSSTMKKLIASKQYRKALDLYNKQSEPCTDFVVDMALKACIKLNDYQHGRNIHHKLSLESLKNPFIQASLIQLYSGLSTFS